MKDRTFRSAAVLAMTIAPCPLEAQELFDNRENTILAHERATGIKKLVTIKGIGHYGIYAEKRSEARRLALDWFEEHLQKGKP